jgi:hypothetical protein
VGFPEGEDKMELLAFDLAWRDWRFVIPLEDILLWLARVHRSYWVVGHGMKALDSHYWCRETEIGV